MSAGALRMTRLLPVPIEHVFDAWTDGDLLSRWFVCAPSLTARVTCDCRVGGGYRIEMDDAGRTVGVAWGTYLEIDRPHRLVFTWTSEGSANVRDSVVTVALRVAGDATELTLTHDIDVASEAGRAHQRGWTGCLESLARALRVTRRHRGPVRPFEAGEA